MTVVKIQGFIDSCGQTQNSVKLFLKDLRILVNTFIIHFNLIDKLD